MVSFTSIPTTLRLPGAYVEIEAGQALFAQTYRALLIGSKLTAGTATANTPVLVRSAKEAESLFGSGSQLALMVDAWLKNNPYNELWAVPLSDHASGVAATATLTLTGTATAAGSVPAYVCGNKVPVAVAVGDANTAVAAALNSAINAQTNLPCTATVNAGVVTLTARNKGAAGNDLDVRVGHYSAFGDETVPNGLSVAISNFAGGSNNPSIATAIANCGDEPYRFWVMAYADATNVTALEAEIARRWGPMVQQYGHGFIAVQGSASALETFGEGVNSQYLTVFGQYDSPTPPEVIAAASAAVVATSLSADPALPFTGLAVQGVVAPASGARFTASEQDALLHSGITPLWFTGTNSTKLRRVITTYQANAWGLKDASWLDLTTSACSAFAGDYISATLGKYARHKAAGEKAVVAPGSKVLKPSTLKGEIMGALKDLEAMGVVENAEDSKVEVARNTLDPTRYDVVVELDLTNPLYILATKLVFTLQTRN